MSIIRSGLGVGVCEFDVGVQLPLEALDQQLSIDKNTWSRLTSATSLLFKRSRPALGFRYP